MSREFKRRRDDFSKLTLEEKWGIVAVSNFDRDSETLKYVYGTKGKALELFAITKSTHKRVLDEFDAKFAADHRNIDLTPKYGQKESAKSLFTEEVHANIVDIHTMCLMEKDEVSDEEFTRLYNENYGTSFAKSTMQSYMKTVGLFTASQYLKPTLSLQQKLARLDFVKSMTAHKGGGIHEFNDHKLEIHIDEKWFYVAKLKRKIRLMEGDIRLMAPAVQHKGHIPKVMFLSAIGVPQDIRLANGTIHHFDGKIGLFLFGNMLPAQRGSKNRRRGDLEHHNIVITAESYREMLTKRGGVYDKIKEKMPWARGLNIRIRHDGAKPHTGSGNEEFLNAYGHRSGWKISIYRQPAQSPDFNKNDLCFFASLQKRANSIKAKSKIIEILIDAVKQAYDEYPEDTLVRVHALQYEIYRQVMICGGGNDFLQPHSGIRDRQNREEEVANLKVPRDMYRVALQ
jgi:hypothetical protein